MRRLPFFAVVAALAGPAVAGESVAPAWTPPTVCEVYNLRLHDIIYQLQAKLVSERQMCVAPAAVLPIAKPATVTPPRKHGRTKGCKPGRTRNARGQCGVWS